jgi:AcrR family transcriptional regulator
VPKVSAAHKEQARRQLIDAALRVVQRDGPEATTTRSILAEAGVSAGMLYSYFPSKEALFEAVVGQAVDEVVTLLRASGGPDATEGTVLIGLTRALLTAPDSAALAWFRGRMSADPDVQAALGQVNRHLVASFAPLVARAQDNGELRHDVDTEALVELVDIIQDGLNRRQVTGSFATSFARAGGTALALLVEAMLPQADPPAQAPADPKEDPR